MGTPGRIHAIDRLRGLVMVLMAIDHADAPLNSSHYWLNGAHFLGAPFAAAPEALSFATRFLTHLCAPTFLFLAGVSVVLSSARAKARGASDTSVDRHLVSRGVVIGLLDPLVMTFAFGVWWAFGQNQVFVFQVLYAIGVALLLSPLLRRLPSWTLVAGAASIIIGNEFVLPNHVMTYSNGWPPDPKPVALSFLMTGAWHFELVGNFGAMVMYPALPWVAPLMLGIAFGRVIENEGAARAARVALSSAVTLLIVFFVVRATNAWGNTALPRVDGSLISWLDNSKYPPGLTYLALELAIMFVLLAGFLCLDSRRGERDPVSDPLAVLGKTALLFYLLHVPILTWGTIALWAIRHGGEEGATPGPEYGAGATWIAWPIVVVALFPVCWWYGRYKRDHRNLLTRYL